MLRSSRGFPLRCLPSDDSGTWLLVGIDKTPEWLLAAVGTAVASRGLVAESTVDWSTVEDDESDVDDHLHDALAWLCLTRDGFAEVCDKEDREMGQRENHEPHLHDKCVQSNMNIQAVLSPGATINYILNLDTRTISSSLSWGSQASTYPHDDAYGRCASMFFLSLTACKVIELLSTSFSCTASKMSFGVRPMWSFSEVFAPCEINVSIISLLFISAAI